MEETTIPIEHPELGRLKYFVVFSCQTDIHVYYQKSSVRPRPPYKAFGTAEEAQKLKPDGKIIIQK